MKKISIVVPVCCEEKNIEQLYARLKDITKTIQEYSWEYIFVNDGSTDGSYLILQKLASSDKEVKVIDFSRNFGKEIALSAGVVSSSGDAVITIDADLQHPPELIPELVKKWENGVDIVIARRKKVSRSISRKIGSAMFYWLMNKISQLEMSSYTTDFRLIDKKVAAVFKVMSEKSRIYRGLIDWTGFKKDYIEFDASLRENGHSAYTYRKLLKLAIDGITSFSAYPLKIAGVLGLIITFFSSVLLMIMFPVHFVFQSPYFSSLSFVVVINTLLTGIVLICLGLMALYIDNIHNEVINRPLYIVKDRLNFERTVVDGPIIEEKYILNVKNKETINRSPLSLKDKLGIDKKRHKTFDV